MINRLLRWLTPVSFFIAFAFVAAVGVTRTVYTLNMPPHPEQSTGRVFPINGNWTRVVYINKKEKLFYESCQYILYISGALTILLHIIKANRRQ
jgi:hypothetical protein